MAKGKKTSKYPVRAAQESDHEKLRLLMAEVDAAHEEAVPHLFTQTEGPGEIEKMLASMVGDETSAVYVAEHDGHIIGMVYINVQQGTDNRTGQPALVGVIEDIVVARDFFGQGLGRALIGAAQQWAQQRQIRQIDMNVWDLNIATDYLM